MIMVKNICTLWNPWVAFVKWFSAASEKAENNQCSTQFDKYWANSHLNEANLFDSTYLFKRKFEAKSIYMLNSFPSVQYPRRTISCARRPVPAPGTKIRMSSFGLWKQIQTWQSLCPKSRLNTRISIRVTYSMLPNWHSISSRIGT